MKATCLRCGQGFELSREGDRRACPGCSSVDWASEDPMPSVAPTMTYYIMGEQAGPGNILTLKLSSATNRVVMANATLSKRMKDDYRHRKASELNAGDGRDLVIAFDRAATDGGSPRWEIVKLARRPLGHPKTVESCRRHQWGALTDLPGFDINGFAHLMPCSCDFMCELCEVSATYSRARHDPRDGGANEWSNLQIAANRERALRASA